MNRKKITIALMALMISVFTLVPSLAVVEENPTPIPEPTPVAPREREAPIQQIVQPVAKTQEQLNKEVEDARNVRIKKNCEANKEKVLSIKARSEAFQTKHQEIYTSWSEKVTSLVAKLDAAGADTAKLKTDIDVLNSMIAEKNGEFSTYHESLATLGADNNCGEDPAGFYSALQAGRTARKQVLTSLQEIKAFIQDTIKVDLQEIKTQLSSLNTIEEEG